MSILISIGIRESTLQNEFIKAEVTLEGFSPTLVLSDSSSVPGILVDTWKMISKEWVAKYGAVAPVDKFFSKPPMKPAWVERSTYIKTCGDIKD